MVRFIQVFFVGFILSSSAFAAENITLVLNDVQDKGNGYQATGGVSFQLKENTFKCPFQALNVVQAADNIVACENIGDYFVKLYTYANNEGTFMVGVLRHKVYSWLEVSSGQTNPIRISDTKGPTTEVSSKRHARG